MPEFDTPGHSASFGPGYPNVIAQCPNVSDAGSFMLNPTKPETRQVVSELWTVRRWRSFAVLASLLTPESFQEAVRVFQATELVHVGGDEVDTTCLEHCDEVRDFMTANNVSNASDLIADYHDFLQRFISSDLQRTSIVWQEVCIRRSAYRVDSDCRHASVVRCLTTTCPCTRTRSWTCGRRRTMWSVSSGRVGVRS